MAVLKAEGDNDAYSTIDSLLKAMADDAKQASAVIDNAVQDVLQGADQDRPKTASQGLNDYITRMRRELRRIEEVRLPSGTGLYDYKARAIEVARKILQIVESMTIKMSKVNDLAYNMKRLKEA